MDGSILRHKPLLAVTLLFFCCLPPHALKAQAPQGVNFQAVARNASGVAYANTPLDVRLRILDGANAVQYVETHAVTTDLFGLFDVVLGKGVATTGVFANLTWDNGPYTVEIDVDDGAGYVFVGGCEFQSVPYALYAESTDMGVGDLNDVDLTTLAPGQTLIWDGTAWLTGSASDSIWSQNVTSAYYNTGRVGIGLDTPLTSLHMADTANFLIGDNLTGSGFKMIYYAAKGAMRVGYLTNPFGGYNYDKFWDYDSVGFYSFAAGQNSRAKGFGSFAFGSFGWADGSSSVAFFGNAKGNNSYTFGGSSKGRGSFTVEGVADEEGGIAMYGYTGGRYGVSIGGGTTGLGASSSREDYAVAIGWNADARGQASIALGPSDAYGYNSFSTGWVTEARGNYSSTFGYQTNAYPYAAMALGRYNTITGDSAAWVATDPVFMIGDGTSDAARSNSFMIQKNGQTAIGYNAPTGMLQVSSALGSLNNGGALDPTHASLLLGTTATGLAFDPNQIEVIGTGLHINFNSPEDLYLNNGGGNVGIGNAAPATKLDVANTGWQFRLNNAGAGGDDWYVGASNAGWAAGGGKFVISPNNGSGNSVFTITPNLQFGINQLNPTDRLHISAAAGEDALRVQVGGTTRLRVHDNGGVSIGANAAPPAEGLVVVGNVYPTQDNVSQLGIATRRWSIVWAANGAIQTSDARLKTNVFSLGYGLDELLRLEPVRYEWIEGGDEKIGFLAQDLQRVIPEVVYQPDTEEGYLGINYAELVPVLVRSIQEQQVTIEAQASALETQAQELEALRAEVEAIKAMLNTENAQP